MNTSIGENVERKDAWEKVTGSAQYIGDLPKSDVLNAFLLTSPYAHARIKSIDPSPALLTEGVRLVLTGEDCAQLFGLLLKDRPLLARGKVRYAGEPVAMVVAREEHVAAQAARRIKVEYEPLEAVFAPSEALANGAPLVHERPDEYKRMQTDIYPEPNSNIASHYQVNKGDAVRALERCEFVVRRRFRLPPSAHAAMETRTAQAQIAADGTVTIQTASQSPYAVRTQMAEAFSLQAGKVRVCVPFVGGGFGGKAPVLLEPLVYLASSRLGGQKVRLALPRELDFEYAPCRIGLEAEIALGADKGGRLRGAELAYWVDCGAYSDNAPYMAKAIAVDCTGPYNVQNIACNVACVYTNHTFATSYRGFGHDSFTFCIESAMDGLARQLKMDPLELRAKNAIRTGALSPGRVVCDKSNTGDLRACIKEIRPLAQWNDSKTQTIKENTVRAKGCACFWKSENPPTNAVSGALVTCNPDGSFNLHTGVVEMGSGGQTLLAQIFAEKLKISADLVHTVLPVDTRTSPEHWKTVASMTAHMAGNAVERAADDIIAQFRHTGALVFGCSESDVEVAHSRVYWKKKPKQFLQYKDIVSGYKSKDGESIGEPVFGRGGFMFKGLSKLDRITGEGRPGPSWTVGAQVVEVEADRSDMTYRILSATTVLDAGCVINPKAMRDIVAGGMAMGLSLASREGFGFEANGVLAAPNFRTYKLMHIGAEPEYRVGFVETPEKGAPHGTRKFTEHGIIGMPAALANALSAAFEVEIDTLPLTPEMLWEKRMEGLE